MGVAFGEEHYQVLVPPTLQNDVEISEGTTDSKGLEDLIDINSEGEEGVFCVGKKGNMKKFPRMKRPTQRKLKEEKIAKKKMGTLDKFLNVSKKGQLQYLSDPDDPPEIKILKDTQSKSNPGVTERKDKDYEENREMESDDEKDTQSKTNPGVTKRKDKDYEENREMGVM